MDILLTETLECIERESENFDKSYDLVDLVVEKYGEEGLAERLYSEIDKDIHWKVVADLYAILIWSTSDNGAQLIQTTDRWISECKDERKINIALNLDTFPFRRKTEMVEKLHVAAHKFPALSEKCNKLIQSRSERNA